ncbi:Unconventional myosin-Ib [Araneus ventricosus]|uniref:Unconventional myosin-Ib n=1 Tax=Araneus ventricosus TaxID=182803 RepID=A0A4Y2SUB7_ARAVE|nr:Unconventional myosin-Ib [Araneus ventricosus]
MYEKTPCDVTTCRGEYIRATLGSESGVLIHWNDFGVSSAVQARKLCHKYRLRFDQTARNRMREKVTASLLFRDRKSSYPKSVSHPFRGDYVRLRHNVKWKKIAAETGDQYVVFADIINKIARASGKCLQTLFVVSTSAMLVMDHRTLQIKYRIPATDIFRISLSPFMDDLAVFHVRSVSMAPYSLIKSMRDLS